MYVTFDTEEPHAIGEEELVTFMQLASKQEPGSYVAVYADENITYGRLVQVLDKGAANGVRWCLLPSPPLKASSLNSNNSSNRHRRRLRR